MKYYEFSEDDKFINTFKTFPQFNHYAVSGNVFFNSLPKFVGEVQTVDILQKSSLNKGISLYENNIDRDGRHPFIEPFLYNQGAGSIGFKNEQASTSYTVTGPGEQMFHSARGPLTASISRSRDQSAQQVGGINIRASALVNASKKYRFLSTHFDLPQSIINAKSLNFVYIPSIFYGSTIKRGSVKLDFYFTGSLVGTLEDTGGRGELIQTVGDVGTGEVAGLIFYDEGVIMLTGSWDINSTNSFKPGANESTTNPRWVHYFSSINDEAKYAPFADASLSNVSCSYGLSYQGMQNTESLTLLAHAPAGEVNYSNNPTFYTHRPRTSATFSFSGLSSFQSTPTSRLSFSLMVPTEAGGDGRRQTIIVLLGNFFAGTTPTADQIIIDATNSTNEQMASLVAAAINGDNSSPLVTYGSNITAGVGFGIKQLYANVDAEDLEKINVTVGSYTNPAQSGPGLFIEVIVDPGGNFFTEIPTTLYLTSSNGFLEQTAPLTNVVSSSVQNFSASYEPTTYISKVGLYDEDNNLIGIAKLAKPIKKENRDSYTFKLKLDI